MFVENTVDIHFLTRLATSHVWEKIMPKKSDVELLMYCVKDVKRRIADAEEVLRQLHVVEKCLTKSPGSAIIITTIYPAEDSEDLKVEVVDSWGNLPALMRQTWRSFVRINGAGRHCKERRAIVRVSGRGYFYQINIPRRFWASGHANRNKRKS